MAQAKQWSEAADVTICRMRGRGATWAEIGRILGLSRNTVIERGRRLRAAAPVKVVVAVSKDPVSDDPNRAPLPAGHRLTWGLICQEPYPQGGDE